MISEKAEDQVAPVSFFDPALKEVRRRVFYQWSRTGMEILFFKQRDFWAKLITHSLHPMHIRAGRVVNLLGLTI